MYSSLHFNTKQRISVIARKMMAEKKLEDITVGMIAELAAITRQTFYYYFQDKYDLLCYIFESDIDTLLQQHRSQPSWRFVLEQLLIYMKEHKAFYMNSIKTEGQNSFLHIIIEYTQNAYIREIQQRLQREQLPESMLFAIQFNSYGAAGSIFSWINQGMKVDPSTLASEIASSMPYMMQQVFKNKNDSLE